MKTKLSKYMALMPHILLMSIFLMPSTLCMAANHKIVTHEYVKLTQERVDAVFEEGSGKEDLLLAEGSLTALGWLVLYGNDEASIAKANQFDQMTFDKYNGTEMIFIRQMNQCYGEMINLGRFDKHKPMMASTEYASIVQDRVNKAFEPDAGYQEFKLAEGSLCALGWITAYGNDASSLEKATAMMNMAFEEWRQSDGYYMVQSSGAYSEMINLGRFKMDEEASKALTTRFVYKGDGTVLDTSTGLIWMKEPRAFAGRSWDEAMAVVKWLHTGSENVFLEDGSKPGDWRLPTNEEWQAMVSWSTAKGADFFLVNQEGNYWTSSTPSNEYGAYHINIFGAGGIDFDSRGRKLNIWPVRNAK